jgi:hypothetical protein
MFFMMEVAMRPLLFDIGGQLGDVPIDDRGRLPLQRRLLTAVPAIAVISGVAVSGVAGTGHVGAERGGERVGV